MWNLEATSKYIHAESDRWLPERGDGVGCDGDGGEWVRKKQERRKKEGDREREGGMEEEREREKEGERKEGDRYTVDSRGAGKHSWEP